MRDTQFNVIEAFHSSARITTALMKLHEVLRDNAPQVYSEALKYLADASNSNLNLQLVLAEIELESKKDAIGGSNEGR